MAMEKRELGMIYGMCFKAAHETVLKYFDPSKESTEEMVQDIEALAMRFSEVCIAAQEELQSEYAHLIEEKPKRGSGYSAGRSGGSGYRGSGSKSSAPGTPTPKQIAFATRLINEKPGVVDVEIDDLAGLSKAEISSVIDTLVSA